MFHFKDWGSKENHFVYSILYFLVQYLTPCFIICLLYKRVSNKVSSPIMSGPGVARKFLRIKKINQMLLLTSLVFFFSWTPIHIFNIVLDVADIFQVSITLSLFTLYILLIPDFPSDQYEDSPPNILLLSLTSHELCHHQPCHVWTA